LLLSLAQTTFTSTLESSIPRLAPGVDPQTVILAGAAGVRSAVPKEAIEGVLLAYNEGIRNVFYLAAGTAGAVFFVCWGMGWKSVKKAKTVSPEAWGRDELEFSFKVLDGDELVVYNFTVRMVWFCQVNKQNTSQALKLTVIEALNDVHFESERSGLYKEERGAGRAVTCGRAMDGKDQVHEI
jgi:hypothetical protein